ncbi:MAG: TrpR YerC/YecD [Lachnospiraceae bacterium]|nr:TrpR YerC/YecD [Lachnospiraceae bacterium]
MSRSEIDIQALSEVIAGIQTPEEAKSFLQDLCAPNEIKAMNQRFQVMRLLCEGRVYTDIMEQTGASTATISRVKRVLDYGNGALEELIRRTQTLK